MVLKGDNTMELSTIIFYLAAFALGIFFGMILELAVDNDMVHKLELDNEKLLMENIKLERDNELLKRMISNSGIQIVTEEDTDGETKNYFNPF